jgi:ectoine hydroxylase-related dioxygenase (phytanoyl-CoA dioxygenase family)
MSVEQEFRSYGIKEANSPVSEVEQQAEEIMIKGFTVVEGVIEEARLEETRRRVDQVYEAQAAEVGGLENLRRVNDESVARCLLAYDEYFLTVAISPRILRLLERLLGDYFTILQQNAIINLAGRENYQTSWHRDLIYQHFVPSRPIAVSALVCIDDFSAGTGGTHVLPASHKLERFPSQDYVIKHEEAVSARAGSAIVFDSMLFHRGGVNTSAQPRRGLNQFYALPFIKQQIDMPRILGGKYSDDDFLSKFLGYQSEAAESVVHWRRQRLKRLKPTDE